MISSRTIRSLSLCIVMLPGSRVIPKDSSARPTLYALREPISPIQRSTLNAMVKQVPWSMLCTIHCRVILMDSVVRTMPVNEEKPGHRADDHVISESERNGVAVRGHNLVWGDIRGEAGGDTTAVYIARDPNVLDSANSYRFVVALLPRGDYAKLVYFRLTRIRGKWHVKQEGIKEG
jgi:hypothetical protein